MRFKNIFAILAAAVSISIASCEKEEIQEFKLEEAGIYFQSGGQTRFYLNIDAYYDSTAFSFSVAPVDRQDTVLFARIRTMGHVKDYDRPVKVSIDTERSTAIEGTHFTADLSKVAIPAGASEFNIPVKFFRTSDILDKAVELTLKLEDNEHFKVYFNEQKNTNVYNAVGETIRADRFVFSVSEIYTLPFYWQYFGNTYFGPWSVAKNKYINSVVGWTQADWLAAGSAASPVQLGRFGTTALIVRNALQALADAGTPMREADGSLMQMGANYQVDYSRYL